MGTPVAGWIYSQMLYTIYYCKRRVSRLNRARREEACELAGILRGYQDEKVVIARIPDAAGGNCGIEWRRPCASGHGSARRRLRAADAGFALAGDAPGGSVEDARTGR